MNLVMDFVHDAENIGKGIAQPFEYLGRTDIIDPAKELAAQFSGNQQTLANARQASNQELGLGANGENLAGGLRTLAGEGAQALTDVYAPGIAKGASEAFGVGDIAANIGVGKIAGGIAKGAVEGGTLGGIQSTEQGVASNQPLNAKNLSLDFLSGVKQGAAVGGVIGGAGGTIQAAKSFGDIANQHASQVSGLDPDNVINNNEAGTLSDYADYKLGRYNPPVSTVNQLIKQARNAAQTAGIDITSGSPAEINDRISNYLEARDNFNTAKTAVAQGGYIGTGGKASDQFSNEDVQKMANSENPDQVEKTLTPVTGPAVAKELAPTVAQTKDTNIIKNEVDNALNNKVASAQPLPQVTSTSDVNTPQQANAEEQSLFSSGQTLGNQDINNAPFINAPGEEGTSKVNTLGAVTGMHDILNSGGTTDEAINHYMETMNSGYGEAQQALNKLLNQAGGGGSLDRSKINASLNPQYDKVKLPEVSSRDSAILNSRYAGSQVLDAGRPAYEAMQQLDDHDLALVRSLRGRDPATIISQANDPKQFAKVVQALKDYNDYTQAAGAQLGQDIPYRRNYGIRTPFLPPEEQAVATGEPNAALPTKSAYTKSRLYNTFEDAVQNGEVPKYESALQDLRADINVRAHDQSQLALARGLDKVYPGQVKIVNTGAIPRGYQQLLIPGGDKIFMPNEIASQINERALATEPNSKLLRGYDIANAIGKNVELGGGLFHGLNTAGIFAGQQLASLKSFTPEGFSALGNVVKNTLSDKATSDYMADLGKEGTFDKNHSILDAANASGLNFTHVASDIGGPEDKGLIGKVSGVPVLKQIHKAIFKRQIPTMMLETFRQQAKGLDVFGNADDREQAIKLAKQINQNYGHLNRDIQGLTPKQFQRAARVMLATDYQEGQIRTLIDALNPKNIGTPEGKLARQTVFGKALLFGGLATAGAVAGGNFQGMTPKQVALAIMNKAINPSFDIGGYKVGLPATQISNVAKPIEQSITGAKAGKGIATGAENFASSHLAFLPSKAEEFGTNKNFEGNAVYGKDFFGRPISAGTVAENVASGILPIPLAQTAQTATGQESFGAALANTVGLNTTPEYNLNYAPVAGQTYIQRLQETPGVPKDQISKDTQFFDLLGQGAHGKNKVITAAETAIEAGNTQKADQIISSYNQKLIQTLAPWARQGGTQYLDSTMVQLLQTALITYGKASQNIPYLQKTNPTSIGAPIQALSSVPQTVGTGGQ